MTQSTSQKRISEFDWLKVLGLLLLIFVHSDLTSSYPDLVYSIQWILIGIFFFVSGYLAYNSLHKRETSIIKFFKSKFWSLYIPFFIAALFYFGFEVYLGVSANPLRLISHVSLLAVFDNLNAGLNNWGFLWFIPYLLVFFLIFCLLEKYVKNSKLQVTLGFLVWFISVLGWVFDFSYSGALAVYAHDLKLGLVFSQFFLVFMFGFWLNKFCLYERLVRFKILFWAVPLFVLFWYDFSNMLSFSSPLSSLEYYLYFNVRSMILGLSAIFIFLTLVKGRVSSNKVVESIAKVSLLIYLSEPFVSYLLRSLIFGGQLHIYINDTDHFILYQATRIAFLFGLLPLLYWVAKKYGVLSKISRHLKLTKA
jgi:surface polysaccharide O-acyltransferase-like enzyme